MENNPIELIGDQLLSHLKYTIKHPCSCISPLEAEHRFLSECYTIIEYYGGYVTNSKVAKDWVMFEFKMPDSVFRVHQITLSLKEE